MQAKSQTTKTTGGVSTEQHEMSQHLVHTVNATLATEKGQSEEEVSRTSQKCKSHRCRWLHRWCSSKMTVKVVPSYLGGIAMRYFRFALVGMAV
jgi:hypothetical protein